MEKLVLTYDWGWEESGGTVHIPFQYSSKEDFISYVCKIVERAETNNRNHIHLFGTVVSWKQNDLPNCIHTLDEWFELNKEDA
jgi:hypothetical protein